MTIDDILSVTEHRPWKLPDGNWKFYQEWNNAIFLHWQVDLTSLKQFVPKELEIDLFEGKPWVSLVAFTMEKIRPRHLPSFPPVSDFDEINIRTYVRSADKTGVYFLSIEGGSRLSCKVARGISGLPYRYSKIARNKGTYFSNNSEYNDHLKLSFSIGKKTEVKNALDSWLTERYALLQDTESFINNYEIHHLEWPINTIEMNSLELSYPRFDGLLNNRPDKIQYSAGVKVLAWGRRRTKRLENTDGAVGICRD